VRRPTGRRSPTASRALAVSAVVALAMAGPACRSAADRAAASAEATRPPAAAEAELALAEGDRAFARREDTSQLEAAIAAYERAALLRPADPAIEVRIARAEAYRGLAAPEPSRAREGWDASARAAERALRVLAPSWAKAIDAGEDPAAAAARIDAGGAEALYWLALGTMRSAQTTGYAAVLAVKDSALGMMTRAAELDERVDAAGPLRALGAWRAALPVAAGGGAAASRAHFERARALAPDDLLGPVSEAETYAVLTQDQPLFEQLLAEVLAADPGRDPVRAPENRIARRRAQELLEREARLF
jgi:TRAP transporter TatT component family protein